MRKIILKMQMSLDGFIEGPNGQMDWINHYDDEAWQDLFKMLELVDTFLLGRKMYPDYAAYWRNTLSNPLALKNELDYAKLADKTTHIVFSKTMEKADWHNTIINKGDIKEEVSKLKQQPGKDMQIVGGATFASAFINESLVDEYRLLINPVILGGGKLLFKEIKGRHHLELTEVKKLKSGIVILSYKPGKK